MPPVINSGSCTRPVASRGLDGSVKKDENLQSKGAAMHRYVLWEAEDRGLLLPYACRMGCCTACAVRIKEGDMYQPQVRPHLNPLGSGHVFLEPLLGQDLHLLSLKHMPPVADRCFCATWAWSSIQDMPVE